MTTVQGLQAALAKQLADAGVENPVRRVAQAIAHALCVSRLDVLANPTRLIDPQQEAAIKALAQRLAAHEPFERITGQREFYGMNFGLNPATLSPRPETELLVQAALACQPRRVLDIGTGSGCVVLAILQHAPAATAVATDLSPQALTQAQQNAQALGLHDRVTFVATNYADDVAGAFDVIVSNPPYIPTGAIAQLDANVRNFDPIMALDGGADGLTAYRHLLQDLPPRLAPQGTVLFEIGAGQDAAITALARQNGWACHAPLADLAGITRVLRFFRP